MWLLQLIYNKFGWQGISIMLVVVLIVGKCNSSLRADGYVQSLQKPKSGDLYIINRGHNYYVHQLILVRNDSFCLRVPNYEINSFKEGDALALRENTFLFSTDSLWMTRSELADLLSSKRLKIH